MRIASNNKLAHYQVELQELQEQTAMLNAQLPALNNQLASMGQYLQVNNGDRKARADFSSLQQRYNSTCSAIRRNMTRIQTLQRQIAMETNRIAIAQQRMAYRASGCNGRRRYY